MKKTVFLILLLVVPTIFVIMGLFGENHYKKLEVYNPRVMGCPRYEGPDSVHRIPPFSFTDQAGKTVTQADFEGKIYIADFFFTYCPDICIEMSSELVRVQDALADKDVKILSHTVDPERDTPEVLANYAERYGADPSVWTFVTGEKQALYEQARCGYFIPAAVGQDSTVDFIHSDKLILVDKESRIRGFYSGTDRKDVDRLISEAQLLMKEYEEE